MQEQLWTRKPTSDQFKLFLNVIGLQGVNDGRPFTREEMEARGTGEAVISQCQFLSDCYVPCKRFYFTRLPGSKAVITIFKQLCRLHGAAHESRELSKENKKILHYRILVPEKAVTHSSEPVILRF